jgi:hypothetical protein
MSPQITEHYRHALGSSNRQNAKDGRTKSVRFIAGDSTAVQTVHGWEISNTDRNVAVKSFSGSKVNDMQDYLKVETIASSQPTLNNSPRSYKRH